MSMQLCQVCFIGRYWYENGMIYPNMGTVWIAVDDADTQNGCLTVSHLFYFFRGYHNMHNKINVILVFMP